MSASNAICFADARRRYRNSCGASVEDEAVDFILDVLERLMDVSIDLNISGRDVTISFVGSMLHREKLAALCVKLRDDGMLCDFTSEKFSLAVGLTSSRPLIGVAPATPLVYHDPTDS